MSYVDQCPAARCCAGAPNGKSEAQPPGTSRRAGSFAGRLAFLNSKGLTPLAVAILMIVGVLGD
jgi:hypothetical protein